MYSILSRDIDNEFVLISTECDAFEEERMQLRKENDALLKVCKLSNFQELG